MASRAPIECPVCHDEMAHGQKLEEHLVTAHTKQTLAKFVDAEVEAMTEEDVSD